MEWSVLFKHLREVILLIQSELASILCTSIELINVWKNSVNQPTMKMKDTY